ncbi:CocE/NonD family hydrolase [Mesorhizobium silamurunense]|uniref:CocE/NonD family hydrolase n=1 Tax=Mesorhizobium silamurunense TaxID=499528 RepID=UPI00177B6BA9|nr:CocE/NonD family hydrolase [Mesorhizobium silamurunense]
MSDEYTPQEWADAVEVWLSSQYWCDGNVGMMGISRKGFNSLQLASLALRALKAIITFPAERFARAILRMRYGREFEPADLPAVGDPYNPLSDQDISEKFTVNAVKRGTARRKTSHVAGSRPDSE